MNCDLICDWVNWFNDWLHDRFLYWSPFGYKIYRQSNIVFEFRIKRVHAPRRSINSNKTIYWNFKMLGVKKFFILTFSIYVTKILPAKPLMFLWIFNEKVNWNCFLFLRKVGESVSRLQNPQTTKPKGEESSNCGELNWVTADFVYRLWLDSECK